MAAEVSRGPLPSIQGLPSQLFLNSNGSDGELPGYQRTVAAISIPPTEHIYSLDTYSGRTWLTLKIQSLAPSAKSLPALVEGRPVVGGVILDFGEKSEKVKSVTVSVSTSRTIFKIANLDISNIRQITGSIIGSGIDQREFLNVSEVLFKHEAGEKLSGKRTWLFSITLPTHTSLNEKEASFLHLKGDERLPPSIMPKNFASCIEYQMLTVVEKSGFFHSDGAYVPLQSFEQDQTIDDSFDQSYDDGIIHPSDEAGGSPFRAAAGCLHRRHRGTGTRRRSNRLECPPRHRGHRKVAWFSDSLCKVYGQ